MKKNSIIITVGLALICVATTLSAQNKLTITDKASFLSVETEALLLDRFESDKIELTSLIDTKRRCDYWFVTLSENDGELILSVLDCNDKSLGTKSLGSRIFSANDQEKSLLLYFSISEILNNPDKNITEGIPERREPASESETSRELPSVDPGKHQTRYFFSPSSYSLEKGELYYNTVYFFIHDVQYGITDNFSMGMGTTIIGFPFYLTPKITFSVDDKSSFAVGDMLLIGTWGTKFSGNLLYATYTRGGPLNNITFGGGYLHTSENDITGITNSPVLNLSGLARVSDHIFFITENYGSLVKTKRTAYYNNWDPVTNEGTYYDEEFNQNVFFIYGLTGFRFINKRKDVNSWQFGLTYVFSSMQNIPDKYNGANWYNDAEEGTRFIAFPAIGYARKFSTRY